MFAFWGFYCILKIRWLSHRQIMIDSQDFKQNLWLLNVQKSHQFELHTNYTFWGDLLKNATHAIQRDTTRHKITGYSTNCIIQPCPVSHSNQFPTRHTFFYQRDTSFPVSSQLGVPSKATRYTRDPTRYTFFQRDTLFWPMRYIFFSVQSTWSAF